MKTNVYILLIFLLAFSFGNAQSTTEVVKVETNNTVSVSENDKQVTVENTVSTVNVNEAILIDASEVKESIARSSSDIRLYFNRLRNIDNLNLLFPKINKEVKA
ncbi:hypothetical protein [Mariniflexile rhizosphaerae]|uniref:hypothetical protein n=1 Tax=unclassified Mariniflexile TaxID=2643887 RepID=UPI000CB98F87|nr:hypothetical protein [Mariniflexile sp. TRM1-10]PLB20706.1 MAG: hypothetical protein TRG1_274 [Flavobacteriaceae bacterium FS1-H7996/R]